MKGHTIFAYIAFCISNTQLVKSFISFLNELANCEFCIVPSTRSIPAAAHPLPTTATPTTQ